MKSYVLSACQVFYTINECKSHSLLHSEIRRLCCSLSAESLRCKYVSKMHLTKRIFVVSTNAVCSVHFSVNVVCVFVTTENILPPSRRLCFSGYLSLCLFINFNKKLRIASGENFTKDMSLNVEDSVKFRNSFTSG